jgi:hypothetical protein
MEEGEKSGLDQMWVFLEASGAVRFPAACFDTDQLCGMRSTSGTSAVVVRFRISYRERLTP